MNAEGLDQLVFLGGSHWHEFVDIVARRIAEACDGFVMDVEQARVFKCASTPESRLYIFLFMLYILDVKFENVNEPGWDYCFEVGYQFLVYTSTKLMDPYRNFRALIDRMRWHRIGLESYHKRDSAADDHAVLDGDARL